MNTIKTTTKLSALWVFILLNIIFRDIHQMSLKSHLEMLLTGYYNGIEVTETLMLIGAFLVEIPIAMVLFSLLWKRKINRVANIIAPILFAAVTLFTPPSDLDDVFHLIIELTALLTIFWTSIQWKHDDESVCE